LLFQLKTESVRPKALRLSIHLSLQFINLLLDFSHLVLQPRNLRITGRLVFSRDLSRHQGCKLTHQIQKDLSRRPASPRSGRLGGCAAMSRR
jgi:hypothetical protein